MHTTADLRREAVTRTFFPQTDLISAIARLGFVQADPIRAPARAQDLILRHRVIDYRAGDLEIAYPSLPVFEDMLHVYGFVHRMHRGLLHPRRIARRWHVEDEHPHLRRAILDHLETHGASHPRAIDLALHARYPRAAIVNAWGGNSNATTRMLEVLHYRGLLHVARRERGIRIYEVAGRGPAGTLADAHASLEKPRTLTPQRRADGLIHLLVSIYAPLPKSSLSQLVGMLGDRALPRVGLHDRIASLLRRGALRTGVVDGVTYVWDAEREARDAQQARSDAPEPTVRFLAPFDPLVWDRRRFRYLWNWDYRFEAYTPPQKRQWGYYALPMLWEADGDAQVIGWVNVSTRMPVRPSSRAGAQGRRVAVEPGYVGKRPRTAAFRHAMDAEVDRLERFLVSAD